MTNYEKIIGMSIDEMAEYLSGIFECFPGGCPIKDYCQNLNDDSIDCEDIVKKWLKKEIKPSIRKILFRGKRKDNSNWVEGAACMHDKDKCSILFQNPSDGSLTGQEIDLRTLGQYSGLTDDVDIVKIFDGDILRIYTEGEHVIGTVEYSVDHAAFIFRDKDDKDCVWGLGEISELKQVIGNIYDNPELINSTTEIKGE